MDVLSSLIYLKHRQRVFEVQPFKPLLERVCSLKLIHAGRIYIFVGHLNLKKGIYIYFGIIFCLCV